MNIQSITGSLPTLENPARSSTRPEKSFNGFSNTPAPQKGASQLAMTAEYYSSQKMYLEYTNGDGDSLVLSMEQVEYQRTAFAAKGNTGSEEWNKIIEHIKEEFLKLREEIITSFIESIRGKDSPGGSEETKVDTENEIPGLPEYWNAENTSQRIVDFATSFFGAYKGVPEEYLAIIKGAIEEGFSQARDILGELPDAVNNLVNDTYEQVMQKLDMWAEQQGIGAEQQPETAVA
jgi:hypothetical protein